MIQKLYSLYQNKPLTLILIIGLISRLLAAFFSKGYAFHDDHFCVIRIAQYWTNGIPVWLEGKEPPLHSITYAGIHYFLFMVMKFLNLNNPEIKMLIIRILHGMWSLLSIYFSYRITLLLSDKNKAIRVAWVMTLLWFMPFLSVKNLVEMVCIPLCLASFYGIVTKKPKWFLAGLLLGCAFLFRYHTILFAGGIGLVLLFKKHWKASLLFSLGYLLSGIVIQAAIDAMLFQYPLQSLVHYFNYNLTHANSYPTGALWNYFLVILGFLFPICFELIIGYWNTRKIKPELFLAALSFFVFHSIIANKQERFMLPLLPLIVILGVVGYRAETFRFLNAKWRKILWTTFWVINLVLGTFLTFTYSKKSRIEPFVFLSSKEEVRGIIMGGTSLNMPPDFYLGHPALFFDEWMNGELKTAALDPSKGFHNNFIPIFHFSDQKSLFTLKKELDQFKALPNYILLVGDENTNKSIERIHQLFPERKMVLEKTIKPALYDQILHNLNPYVHQNEITKIYRIEKGQ